MPNKVFPTRSQGIDAVINEFSSFLSLEIGRSQQYPPPGKNAASGWFWAIMGRPESTDIFQLDENMLDEETKTFYRILKTFFIDFMTSWRQNTNANGRGICWELIVDGAKSLADDFVRFIFDDPQASENMKNEIQKMYDSYTKECVFKGQHMNGWIATYSRQHANTAISLLEDNGFLNPTILEGWPNSKEITETKIIADLFGVMCSKIASFSTDHQPWLKAEWQLQLTATCDACLTALNSQHTLFLLNRPADVPYHMRLFMTQFKQKFNL